MDPLQLEALLLWPFLACLVLTGIHCYLGIHVVGRGVIFVDLALAQLAFLGSAVALTVFRPSHPPPANVPAVRSARPPDLKAQPPLGTEAEPITPEDVDRLIPAEQPRPAPDANSPPGASTQSGRPDAVDENEPHGHGASGFQSVAAYAGGVIFTLLGAALFALGRLRHEHIPQEAIIGIIYAVSASLALVLLYKAPQDVAEQTQGMLVGRILFVEPASVVKTAVLYAVVGLLHYRWRRPFLMISFQPQQAEKLGMPVRWWDFLFYATFGVVVTSSVQIAGVLLVFSYLIVPAVCAMLFFTGLVPRLCFGWAVGFVGSVAGIGLSVWADIPTGASIVAAFGALLVLLLLLRAVPGMRG